ncbi:hypothetical protein GCM10009105_22290 [Dokdonella soli]|uniref:Ferrous iron transport protein A n=1 Tax=Dokdonella soli TaxID=529810 RepID=A0ABN1IKC3_9GAMM
MALGGITGDLRADPPLQSAQGHTEQAAAPTIAVVTLHAAGEEADPDIVPAPGAGPGIAFDELPREIGVRVRVLTRGEHVHVGMVRAADARHVTLSVSQRGGSATYVLSRDQIERIDPG